MARSVRLAQFGLLFALALVQLVRAHPGSHPYETSPYLHFPHSTRNGDAFVSAHDVTSFKHLELPDEDKRQNPVLAFNRHPNVKRALQSQEHSVLAKRDTPVTNFVAPFPPAACECLSMPLTAPASIRGMGCCCLSADEGCAHNSQQMLISSDPTSPHARADIDINNLTTIALVAESAVARMQTWYLADVFE